GGGGGSGGDGSDGEADPDPISCDPAGRTWLLDLSGGSWVEPSAGVGDLLADSLGDQFVLELPTGTASSATVLVGLGTAAAANECVQPEVFSAGFSNPTFQTSRQDFRFIESGQAITVQDMTIEATVSSDCDSLYDGTLTGHLDAREFGPFLSDLLGVGDPDEVCQTVASFGLVCSTCSDGGNYCVDLRIEALEAGAVDYTLPVEAEDCDPDSFDCAHSGRMPYGWGVLALGMLGLAARRRE
ncbi:MAG TPA: hypothetical protein DFR83_26105, partial [Deltaproteobacteria bacterium]|nr:hypothetical protein [Deltaproteobacteria bacterium]